MCPLRGTNWIFIFQNTAFFIVTAVNTSNLEQIFGLLCISNYYVSHSKFLSDVFIHVYKYIRIIVSYIQRNAQTNLENTALWYGFHFIYRNPRAFPIQSFGHVPNMLIRMDLQTLIVIEDIRHYSSHYNARLSVHPNDPVPNLMAQPDNRRLRRHLPNDLSTRFYV
jgi:hypothetical protein